MRCRCGSRAARASTRGSTPWGRGRSGSVTFPARLVYVATGKQALPLLTLHDADRLVVRCDVPLPLQVDGEDLGDVSEAVLEAERDAVTVLAP